MPAEREQRGSPPAHATGAVQFVAVDDIAPDESFRLRPDGDVSELATALGRLGQLSPIELRPCPGVASDAPRWQVVAGFRRLAAVRMLARDRVLARLHGELGDQDAWGLALGEALLHEPLTSDDLESLRERLRASGVAPWAEELVDDALVRAPVAAELRERFFEFLRASEAPSPAAARQPLQARDPSSTTPAGQPSWSRAPAPGSDEPPPGVDRDERGQGSTEPPTSTDAPAPIPTPNDLLAQTATSVEPGEPSAEPPEDFIEVTPDELVQDLVGRLAALNQDLATAVEAWKDLPPEGRRALLDQAQYVAALLPFMETPD